MLVAGRSPPLWYENRVDPVSARHEPTRPAWYVGQGVGAGFKLLKAAAQIECWLQAIRRHRKVSGFVCVRQVDQVDLTSMRMGLT
jgi:hypothetical protein